MSTPRNGRMITKKIQAALPNPEMSLRKMSAKIEMRSQIHTTNMKNHNIHQKTLRSGYEDAASDSIEDLSLRHVPIRPHREVDGPERRIPSSTLPFRWVRQQS